jgi:dihydrofolate reductase
VAAGLRGVRLHVFSSSLTGAAWSNSTMIRGNVVAEVTKLKQQAGRDLVIYGHGLLGQTLLQHRLLDELRFSVHPVLVGSGKLLFQEGGKVPLKLLTSERLETGVVVLSYAPA